MVAVMGWWNAFSASRGLAVFVLLVSNAIPLIGVVFFGWDVFSLLVLYWIESGVIGFVNLHKIRRAEGPAVLGTVRATRNGQLVPQTPNALAVFFAVHYGGFWLGHGLFVFLLPTFVDGKIGYAGISLPGVAIATVVMAISHYVTYRVDYIGHGLYRQVSPGQQMMAPYPRVITLHLTIILGSFLVAELGQPLLLLVLLVFLKTAIELLLYERSRRGATFSVGLSMGS